MLQSERPSLHHFGQGFFLFFCAGAVAVGSCCFSPESAPQVALVMNMGTSKCDRSPLSTMRALGGCAGVLVGFCCIEVALSKKEFHASCRACLHGVEQLRRQGLPSSGKQHRTGDARSKHLGYVRCLGIYAAFFIYGPAAGAATWTHAARQFLPQPPLLRTISKTRAISAI
ncbi:hypothetical protein [Comamonas jiangduensis]|uniref:hypothetical protein n=1 Tax=Comamonas jiangduensis TaxID=1194168 RepID=UPI0015823685|nr:hypothetical protein [Comamonas jiangduensis]